jgi:hypothetical protein
MIGAAMIDTILSRVRRHARLISLAAVVLGSMAGTAGCLAGADSEGNVDYARQALEPWPYHVTQAQTYVNDINNGNNQINNLYGSPASITYDDAGVLHATSMCGSFTTQLLMNTYPNVITGGVMQALTGSTSPSAEQWHDSIAAPLPHASSGGISLLPMDAAAAVPTGRTMSSFQVGDILASRYVVSGATGHVMTAGAITQPAGADLNVTLTGTRVIPGVSTVNRWRVMIFDSTQSVHGTATGAVADSRLGDDATESDGNDHGLGSGHIFLYEDATAGSSTIGQLVGWTWSNASSYTFQFTDANGVDNNGKTTYRRMVIGRMSGTGL